MSNIPFTLSENTVTVFIDGNTYPVDKSNPQYNNVLSAIKSNDLESLRKAVNLKQTMVEQSSGKITIDNGVLYCNGEQLKHGMVERIVAMFNDGFDVLPYMRFLDNLLENPSYRAVNELYGFLEACNLPITKDGHFLAYKIVSEDYTDIYTGKIDNSVGQTVSMPRNEVDEDSEVTCSNGLHVCSQEYLPHYGTSSGSRIMVTKVNPRDVVAVPRDYNNSKMRVCEYVVVDELDDRESRIVSDFTEDYSEDVCSDESEFETQTDMFDDEFFEDETEAEDFEEVSVPSGTVNSASLTYSDVWDIHSFLEDGSPLAAIAKQFKISPRQVGRIRDGENHGHVKREYEKFKQQRQRQQS